MFEPNTGKYSNDEALEISEAICAVDGIYYPDPTWVQTESRASREPSFGGGLRRAFSGVGRWFRKEADELTVVQKAINVLKKYGLDFYQLTINLKHSHYCEGYAIGQGPWVPYPSFAGNDTTRVSPDLICGLRWCGIIKLRRAHSRWVDRVFDG